MTFSAKRGCGCWWLSVEPPSPAALRRTTGRQTALRSNAPRGQTVGKIEVDEAGRASKFQRSRLILSLEIGFCLVSALFDIDDI